MAENSTGHPVTAVIYTVDGDFFKAAALDDDYLIPMDYLEGLGLGSWIDIVVGADADMLQLANINLLEGEIRDGIFMLHEVAQGEFSVFEPLDTYVCESEHYGIVACCDGVIPLGLPEGVPILLRRTTAEEEKRFAESGYGQSVVSYRWIVCEILGTESTFPKKPVERRPELDRVTVPPMKVGKKVQPTRMGVVTGCARHIERVYSKKVYIWTPGLRTGVEFTINLRPSDPPLVLGNWIEFPMEDDMFENRKNGGFLITDFKKVKPGYPTEAVRNTVEIRLPRVKIDKLTRKVFTHHEFNQIFDKDDHLIHGQVMDVNIVRGKPKEGAFYCWRVVKAEIPRSRRGATATVPSANPVALQPEGVPAVQSENRPTDPRPVPQMPREMRLDIPSTSNHIQPAAASQSSSTMIPVSVVSLAPVDICPSDARYEVAFVSSITKQKDIYTVWLTQSHLEGLLIHTAQNLHLGASFQGRFYVDDSNQVKHSEFLEEVANVVDGGIDDNDEIMIYSDVVFRQGDTFWNNVLGIVRDPNCLALRNDHNQAVVIGRLRIPNIPGHSWCITNLENNEATHANPIDPRTLGMRELLEAFRQFFQDDSLNSRLAHYAPEEHFILNRYFRQ